MLVQTRHVIRAVPMFMVNTQSVQHSQMNLIQVGSNLTGLSLKQMCTKCPWRIASLNCPNTGQLICTLVAEYGDVMRHETTF